MEAVLLLLLIPCALMVVLMLRGHGHGHGGRVERQVSDGSPRRSGSGRGT